MKPSIKFMLIFLFFLPGMEISAQTPGDSRAADSFPRLEPDPQALLYARKTAGGGHTGDYSWKDLAEISLWASGGTDRAVFLEQIFAAADDLQAAPDFPAPGRSRAEYILNFMHRKLLRSYSLNQTRVDTLFSSGRYNCVSSAVVYVILAKAAEIDVCGVMTRDHAFVSVIINGETIDVETTNPSGFDPGSRKEFSDQFGRLTGFTYVPARNYRDRAVITPIELVSLILSNRISELESRNRFAEAAPLAIDRAALLSGEYYPPPEGGSPSSLFEGPKRDMMNRLFNYSAFLVNSGREEDCLRWTAAAAPRYPDERRWGELNLAAVNNRLQKLVKAGQTVTARTFLDNQKPVLLDADYKLLDSILVDAELLDGTVRIRTVDEGNSVLAAIAGARESGRINTRRAEELLNFAIQKTAAIVSLISPAANAAGRNWLGAVNYIEQAIDHYGSSAELEQTLNNYRANRAIDFHNRFASAWNTRNFEEAAQIVTEGLAEFPGNRQLLADQGVLQGRSP